MYVGLCMCVCKGKWEEAWFAPIFAVSIWSNIKKYQIASPSAKLCWQGKRECECTHSGLFWLRNKTELRQALDWKMTQWLWLWQQPQSQRRGVVWMARRRCLQPSRSNSLNYQIALAARSNLAPTFNGSFKHSFLTTLWLETDLSKLTPW